MSFTEIYQLYYNKVKRHTACMLNQTDVDNTLQEIFLKIEKALPDFRNESRLSTWIHRITINHCIDQIRKRKIEELNISII